MVPDLKSLENIWLVAVFIVPGFVIVYVRSRCLLGRMPSMTDNVVAYFTLSLIYYVLMIPLVQMAMLSTLSWGWRAVIWSGISLLGPSIFGLLLGVMAQKAWMRRFCGKYGIKIIHVIPSSWDWRLSSMPAGGMFVAVTLNSDSIVYGYWGIRSFASSDMSERDIYVEELYDFQGGQWTERDTKIGILIPHREIRYIEFFEPSRLEAE